jgi:hypothetical protein
MIRSYPFEEFTVGDHRAKPRLTRKQIIHRVLEHPHVDRCDEMGKLLKRNLGHIRDLVHVTNHDDCLVWHVPKAAQNALALILLTCPRVLIFGGLVSFDDNVLNLVEPLGVTLLIFIEIERLWTTHVIHFGLDEYETVYVSIEDFQSKFQYVKLIIEHERVTDHLNL